MAELDVFSRVKTALADRYAIERELGQGGTAIVYLAQDLRHSRPVAIKVLRPELAAVVGADRFLQEIDTVARLQHPHILPLYDSGEADGLLYFVMMYAQGETLRDRLERERLLPVDDVVAIARDVISALSFAHQQGVIHRDIKPENILLIGGAAVVADFGIARALRVAGQGRMTDAGLALGTPLYMSPEQAAASGSIDARSDIYSLGCVIYEMLGGAPPFTGLSAGDVMAHHLHERPRPITDLRSTVPPALALATAKALQKLPADRFASVADFGEALRIPSGERPPIPMPRPRSLLRAGIAAAAVAGLAIALTTLWPAAPLDPAYYLITPFAHRDGAAPELVNGAICARALGVALQRWSGLHVVPEFISAGIAVFQGPAPVGLQAGRAAARAQGAGRVVLGEVWQSGLSVHVLAAVYDARSGRRPLREQEVVLRTDLADLDARFHQLADSLVVGTGLTPTARAAARTTRSLTAWLVVQRADSALYRWDLPLADSLFRVVAALEPDNAYAPLRSAQVRQWGGEDPSAWQADADRAAALAAHLDARDAEQARALAALAAGRYADACRIWRRQTRSDSTDVYAWYGLGDCLRRDPAVVPDAASPSHFRFRASWQEASDAFRRALSVAPLVHRVFAGAAYVRLAELLDIEADAIRAGRTEGVAARSYGAYAGLAGDTIIFVPYLLADVLAGATGTTPASLMAAVERSRATFQTITASWVEKFPASFDAWISHALALERSGRLDSADLAEQRSAPRAAERALALARSNTDRVRAGLLGARIWLKSGDVGRAARLADQTLALDHPADPALDLALAGLAALLGRAERAAALAAVSAPGSVVTGEGDAVAVSQRVAALGARLQVYAGFGGPTDTLRALAVRTRNAAEALVTSARRRDALRALFDVPVGLAHDALADFDVGAPGPSNWLLELNRLRARGRTDSLAAAIARIDAAQTATGMLPGAVAMDGSFGLARLQLAAGDTAGAVRRLDAILPNLGGLSPWVLTQPPAAAAVGRAMALRADLAFAERDTALGERWVRTLHTLWAGADVAARASLSPEVRRRFEGH